MNESHSLKAFSTPVEAWVQKEKNGPFFARVVGVKLKEATVAHGRWGGVGGLNGLGRRRLRRCSISV